MRIKRIFIFITLEDGKSPFSGNKLLAKDRPSLAGILQLSLQLDIIFNGIYHQGSGDEEGAEKREKEVPPKSENKEEEEKMKGKHPKENWQW